MYHILVSFFVKRIDIYQNMIYYVVKGIKNRYRKEDIC